MKHSKHCNYLVLPSVIRVGEETRVRIIPRAEHARFDNRFTDLGWGDVAPKQRFPEEWFTHDTAAVCRVKIVPFTTWHIPHNDGACDEYRIPVDEDGGLTVCVRSDAEQEIQIKVFSAVSGNLKCTFSIYAVRDDLFGKRAYKGDLHSHSIYSDGQQHYSEIAANYRASAFDFLALTDHFKRFPSVMMKQEYDALDCGLTLYHGEEVHVPDITYHYVHIGGDYSVNEWFVDNREAYEAEFREICDSIDMENAYYRDFAARLTWIHRANKKAGGLSIFAHPNWRWVTQNVPDAVIDYAFSHGLMDVFELMGGQSVGENNIQLAVWQDWAAEGKRYPIVCSSDQHSVYRDGDIYPIYDGCYTIVFAEDPSFEVVGAAILNSENVAVENMNMDRRTDFRAYGSRRYVAFAQFLWREFYPLYEYYCAPIGQMMKMYFEGDASALAAARREQLRADDFAEKFFGRKPL